MLKRVCCRCLAVLSTDHEEDAAVTHTFCLNCLPDVFPYKVESVDAMTPDMLDALPYGVVRLDEENRVIAYSKSEEALARRSREDTLGRDFFEEVAPCANVKALAGWIADASTAGRSDAMQTPFIFDFPHGRQLVELALAYDATSRSTTITVDVVDEKTGS